MGPTPPLPLPRSGPFKEKRTLLCTKPKPEQNNEEGATASQASGTSYHHPCSGLPERTLRPPLHVRKAEALVLVCPGQLFQPHTEEAPHRNLYADINREHLPLARGTSLTWSGFVARGPGGQR